MGNSDQGRLDVDERRDGRDGQEGKKCLPSSLSCLSSLCITIKAMSVRDVIIIGAGPSGLASAIHAKEHHLDYEVVEQGVLVNSIFRFPPQMVFFTTPELLEIGGVPFMSPFEKPTRAEA